MSGSVPSLELTIEGLSAAGEGTVLHQGARITVPYALPGERVRVALSAGAAKGEKGSRPGRLLQRLTSAADRAEPPCPHFGRCGGCAVQHMTADAETRWKAARIATALERHGVAAPPPSPAFRSPPNDRRRAELGFRRLRGGTVLGFQARGTHEIVDMRTCFVLAPALVALLPALRTCLDGLLAPGQGGTAVMLAGDEGVDLTLELPQPPALDGLERLADFATAADLARISWRADPRRDLRDAPAVPVAERRPVGIRMGQKGGVFVESAAGRFLQASPAAQREMTAFALAALDGISPVLDLYSGAGTFSLPLAQHGALVHAVEGQRPPLAALIAAARRSGLAGVTIEQRDLTRRPLDPAELGNYGGVIFDPPRVGAAAQAAALAGSAVPRVLAVSCNPASFARDAALLQGGGYRLVALQPIDQFIWSAHVELVALFQKQGV